MALTEDIWKNVNYYSGASFGNIIIDTLTSSSSSKWGGSIGTGATLTYSFPWTTSSTATWATGYDSEPTATKTGGLNSSQIKMARLAFGKISSIVNIKFTEVAETSTNYGDIRIGFSSNVGGWGHASYPNTSSSKSGGDVWISSDYINKDFSLGTYNFSSLLHELGHALGLKHPFEGTPKLPVAQDYNIYTLMSYTSYKSYIPIFSGEKTSSGSSVDVNYQSIEPDNYGVYDIAALQALYGANKTSNTGNNTYKYGTTAFYTTIWDAGGIDTIDLSSTTHSNIVKLTAGSYSTINFRSVESQIAEQQLKYKTELGTSYSSWVEDVFLDYEDEIYTGENALGIAYGAIIENAIGGSASDTITGNSVNNTLSGLAGNDVLNGGKGADIMLGGAGNDIYYVDNASDKVYETTTTSSTTNATGTDSVNSSISSYTLGNYVENLTLTGSSAINGMGNSLNNVITGNIANNVLNGGTGIDTVSYSNATKSVTVSLAITAQQDTLGAGKDTLSNFENITGSSFSDILTGNSSANTLNGGLGNDILKGGTSKDTFVFNTKPGSTNIDKITDFSVADDTIKLENGIFTKLTATGLLNSANFVSNNAGVAADKYDYLVYEKDTGKLFYDADGSTTTISSVQIALIENKAALTYSDFTVI